MYRMRGSWTGVVGFVLLGSLPVSCGGSSDVGVFGGDGGNQDATRSPPADATEDSPDEALTADATGDTASGSEAGDEGASDASDASPEDAADSGADSNSGADAKEDAQDATAPEDAMDSGVDAAVDAATDADASSTEDAHDDATGVDSAVISDAGDGAADATASDAAGAGEGGGTCTPPIGHAFPCGASPCASSATEYCIYGPVPNTCQPLPAACQCAETFNCECLSTHLTCDGDAGFNASCDAHNDAGLVESPDAAFSSYFWIAAHTCP
jgi:hypothetical protein